FFSSLVSDRQRFFVGLTSCSKIAPIGKNVTQSGQHVCDRILVVDLLGRGFGLLIGGFGGLQITLLAGQLSQIVQHSRHAVLVFDGLVVGERLFQQLLRLGQVTLQQQNVPHVIGSSSQALDVSNLAKLTSCLKPH